jgi:acid phosphatase
MKNTFPKFLQIFFGFIFTVVACNKSDSPANLPIGKLPYIKNISLPKPDHVVIVIEENHAYSQLIGSDSSPYINSLAEDPYSATFINSYAVTHPSQPNYLALYSGSTQGVANDNHPANEPFTTPNLGQQLINASMSYSTYSESLPYAGFNGDTSGAYFRKHNPAANWIGTGINQIPASTDQPFTSFPSDFTKLPTVSIVIPNINNDMHNGTVSTADAWLKNNLENYVQWAKSNNSLFILTFDEDNDKNGNHILTIFTGAMVRGGEYPEQIYHYSILRTIEDMYRLPYAGNAVNVSPINSCWK